MRILHAYKPTFGPVKPALLDEEQKMLLSLSVMLMLSLNFALNYLSYSNYPHNLLDVENPGFWLFLLNISLTTGIVLLTKWVFGWSWRELGLGKPLIWWRPLVVSAVVFTTLVLFSQFIVPVLTDFSGPTEKDHLLALRGNFPKLISVLTVGWITSAFLEELVFRSFLINSLDMIFGETRWSQWLAVVISAVIFGLIHAYQGLTGILVTGSIGLIFGAAYLLNGRRIWSLILVHGIVDTIYFFNIYNG